MNAPTWWLAELQRVKRLRESASWRRPACFVHHRAGHREQDGEQGQGKGPPPRAPRWGQGGHLQCHPGEERAKDWLVHTLFRHWRTSSWSPTLALVIVSSKGSFLTPPRGEQNLDAVMSSFFCVVKVRFSNQKYIFPAILNVLSI